MPTSSQIRASLAAVAKKKADVDKDIGDAEKLKAKKETEANTKAARAAQTSSATNARTYQRQADSARKAAAAQAMKIGQLSKKRADHVKTEAKLTNDLNAAIAREARARAQAEEKAVQERRRQDRQREQAQKTARAASDRRIGQIERRLDGGIAALQEPRQEKLRILYATATPEGDLRVSQEVRRVRNGIEAAAHRDLIEILHAPDVTADDLLDHLSKFQPHVLHFSGHADGDVLVFDDGSLEGNEGHEIPIEAFLRAVSAPDRPPTLIVLNACESAARLAELASPTIPMTIGMSQTIGDADAIVFATRFYRSLADGQSVASALELARAAMEMNGLEDHDLPTLFLAPGVEAHEAILVKS